MEPESLSRLIRTLHAWAGPGAAGVSDAQLLERFVTTKDEAAFELLLWRHGPMVLGVCRRLLRHTHDAEDAFQATFLALARKAGSIGRGEAVGAWLASVAYRVALRVRADVTKRSSGAEPLDGVASPHREWDDLGEVLDEEIQRLPARLRSAFVLCVLDGKTGEEAARELGCAPGTVSSRLTRARERLRRSLTRRGVAPAEPLSSERLAIGVPPALLGKTLSVAVGVGAVPARVAAYTEGVLRAMVLTKLKVALTCVLLAGVVALGGAMAAQAIDPPEPPQGKQPEAKRAATKPEDGKNVVRPKPSGLPRKLVDQISFEAIERQDVFAPAAGTVKELQVDLGDRVKAGQLLFRIDSPQLAFAEKEAALAVRAAKWEIEEAEGRLKIAQQEVAAAQTQLQDGMKELEAATTPKETADLRPSVRKASADLRAKESSLAVSRMAVAAAKLKVAGPELAWEKARHNLKQAEVRAAFAGVVTARNCFNHQEVSGGRAQGEVLLAIQRIDRLRARILLPRPFALETKPGMPVKITFDPATEAKPIDAAISRIGYTLGNQQHMQAEIDIPNPKDHIRPGMYGRYTIELPPIPGALRLPSSCIIPARENLFGTYDGFVYVVRDGKARRTKVTLVIRSGAEVEILSGLSATDLVLANPAELRGEEVPLDGMEKAKAK